MAVSDWVEGKPVLPCTVDTEYSANGFAIRDARGRLVGGHMDRARALEWANEINGETQQTGPS